jgi:hypothetical protein
VLPWLLVAGLVLGRGRATELPTSPAPEVGTEVAAAPQPTTPPHALLPELPSPETPLDPALGALAALTVQGALTTADAAGIQRYIDLALPEAATWMGDVAIVRVAAVVLDGAQGGWDTPRRARYAVPIRADDRGFTVLGPPWALPDPPQTTPTLTAPASFEDPTRAEAAATALAGAGYQNVTIRSLARDPTIPGVLLAEVDAVAPGESSSRTHLMWLRDDPVPTLLGQMPRGSQGEDGRAATAGGRGSGGS